MSQPMLTFFLGGLSAGLGAVVYLNTTTIMRIQSDLKYANNNLFKCLERVDDIAYDVEKIRFPDLKKVVPIPQAQEQEVDTIREE